MRKTVLAAGIAMLVLAGCSKPTELASEANAKYDRRDPVVAPPAIGEEVDTTPVEPVPGSAEAEALAPVELQPTPGEPIEGAPVETVDPVAPPTGAETLQPPAETAPPATEAAPPVTEPAAPAQTVPPQADTPPAPAPTDQGTPKIKRRSPHIRLPGPAGDLAIGVMGGSFDPPHSGHAHVIESARRALGLDRIWVFVAAGNPLKKTQTAFVDRLGAARRRLSGPRTIVSGLEAQLGLRYTIDLLMRLKRAAPAARFVWIMGADNLRDFHKWRRWREIAKLAPIAIIARPGANPQAGLSRFARMFSAHRLPEDAAQTLKNRKPPAWVYITTPLDLTSSTDLRAIMMANALPPI